MLREVEDPNQVGQDASRIERTPLVMTTAKGNKFSVDSPFELMYDPAGLMRKFIEGDKPVAMGYLIGGRFKSSFPAGIEIEVEQESAEDPNETEKVKKRIEGLTEASEDCAVAVFSDVDFISDILAYQNSFFARMVYGDNSALMTWFRSVREETSSVRLSSLMKFKRRQKRKLPKKCKGSSRRLQTLRSKRTL